MMEQMNNQDIPTSSASLNGGGEGFPPASVKTWIGRLLILSLPMVRWIFLVLWAMDREKAPNLRNFSRGYLIFFGVLMTLIFVFYFVVIMFVVMANAY